MSKLMKYVIPTFITAILLWLCGFAGFIVWQSMARVQAPSQKTDAILVLTGGTNRIHSGLMLMAAGHADHMMISGVTPGLQKKALIEHYNFVPVIEQKLLNHCCITLGEMASSTVENALEAAPWIRENQFKSIRLVTSVYHIPRALLMLKEHAFDQAVHWVLHPVRPRETSLLAWNHWRIMIQEYTKLTVALFIPLARTNPD